jgi:hypothetical protein
MGSGAMMYAHNKFHNHWFRHSKVNGGDLQTHRQHGDLISLFLFFQTKEIRLKTVYVSTFVKTELDQLREPYSLMWRRFVTALRYWFSLFDVNWTELEDCGVLRKISAVFSSITNMNRCLPRRRYALFIPTYDTQDRDKCPALVFCKWHFNWIVLCPTFALKQKVHYLFWK